MTIKKVKGCKDFKSIEIYRGNNSYTTSNIEQLLKCC